MDHVGNMWLAHSWLVVLSTGGQQAKGFPQHALLKV